MEYCEGLSDDKRSSQVVLRCCFRLEWINEPFLLGKIIESIIWGRLDSAGPISEKFFVENGKKFLKSEGAVQAAKRKKIEEQ